jgi:hypothetical protein
MERDPKRNVWQVNHHTPLPHRYHQTGATTTGVAPEPNQCYTG